MVISHILGGIGNQMFQFATARALSLSKGQPLYLDIYDFDGYTLHNGFQLDSVFDLNVEYADSILINRTIGFRNQKLIKRLIRRPLLKYFRGKHFVMEPHSQYWPQITSSPDDCYLYGYWQSEKYFKAFENIIRNDFTFRGVLDSQNSALEDKIRRTSSISVHIRRGDYISNSNTSKIMDVCRPAYYEEAIRKIGQQLDAPHCYIFSDDMQWVRENLSIPYPVEYVEQNYRKNSYLDMQLMSTCKHHVIANSSFSWWGAWLNPDPKKIVIAPTKWFVNSNNDYDLLPPTWIRI